MTKNSSSVKVKTLALSVIGLLTVGTAHSQLALDIKKHRENVHSRFGGPSLAQ